LDTSTRCRQVYTLPTDRGVGAANALMQIVMTNFRARGGKALFLDTEFGSTAYRIYQRSGFEAVEPHSMYMAFYAEGEAAFNAAYFAGTTAEIQALEWRHWPSAQALFIGDFPGRVRATALGFIGRMTAEGGFLLLLRAELERCEQGEAARAFVLLNTRTQAVVGFAMWDWHPIWPQTCLIDVYCHPSHWSRANELLDALKLPHADRFIAYTDAANAQKIATLQKAGFAHAATLPDLVRDANGGLIDVLVFGRQPI
jgi:hypothetical protein